MASARSACSLRWLVTAAACTNHCHPPEVTLGDHRARSLLSRIAPRSREALMVIPSHNSATDFPDRAEPLSLQHHGCRDRAQQFGIRWPHRVDVKRRRYPRGSGHLAFRCPGGTLPPGCGHVALLRRPSPVRSGRGIRPRRSASVGARTNRCRRGPEHRGGLPTSRRSRDRRRPRERDGVAPSAAPGSRRHREAALSGTSCPGW